MMMAMMLIESQPATIIDSASVRSECIVLAGVVAAATETQQHYPNTITIALLDVVN